MAPIAALVLPAVAVGAGVYVESTDTAGVGEFCRQTGPGTCGMAGNLLIALLAAAIAFAVLRGWKSRRALRHYIRVAKQEPLKLIRWAPDAQAEVSHIRDPLARDIVSVLVRRGPARVVVVQGRNGAGKTALFLRLTQGLPKESRLILPLPVTLRQAGSFDAIGRLTRETFVESVDAAVDSDGDADVIWRWARKTRRLVVLLDDLDDSPAMHPHTAEAGAKLESAIEAMTRAGISVVLATSHDIRWNRLPPMRFSLDGVDRDAARRYVAERITGRADGELAPRVGHALAAIERASGDLQTTALCDVRRIAALEAAQELPQQLPENPDRGRAVLLDRWLDALCRHEVEQDKLTLTRGDVAREQQRREAAVAAAEAVAAAMRESIDAGPVAASDLAEITPAAVDDAVALLLLFRDRDRVGFASRELQAMFVAKACDDPDELEKAIDSTKDRTIPEREPWIEAAVAWAVRHHADDPRPVLPDHLLAKAKQAASGGHPDPRLVEVAARTALACERDDLYGGVAGAAVELDGNDRDVAGLRAVVDACARFGGIHATQVLWHFAQAGDVVVEWEAATALLNAQPDVLEHAKADARRLLAEATDQGDEALAAEWRSPLANRIGSLGWLAPSWRDAEVLEPALFEETTAVVLKTSPLQGEVALARGHKLASLRAKMSPASVAEAKALLYGDPPPRSWIARLFIVQALTAEARRSANGIGGELKQLARSDPHPLVREAAELGVMAAGAAQRFTIDHFVWNTERDAVAMAHAGAGRMDQLAGDVVLLCNLVYNRAMAGDQAGAETLATANELPPCLGRPLDPSAATCDCGFGLCEPEVRWDAVRRRRAPLTAAFCLEQERRAGRLSAPSWDSRWLRVARARDRRRYWHEMARIASS